MEKKDIAIVVALVALLLVWLFYQNRVNSRARAEAAEEAAAQAAAAKFEPLSAETHASAQLRAGDAGSNATTSVAAAPAATQPAPPAMEAPLDLPATTNVLRSGEAHLTISSRGATLREVTMLAYRATPDPASAPVRLDFAPYPALALSGVPEMGADADFETVSADSTNVVLRRQASSGLTLERSIALRPDYRVEVTDRLINSGASPIALEANSLSLGAIRRGTSKNDILGVDSLADGTDARGRVPKVQHWDGKLMRLFTGGGRGFGCGGAPAADLMPLTAGKQVDASQKWMALKSRFFVQTFSSDATNRGFNITLGRVAGPGPLRLDHVSAEVLFDGDVLAPGATIARHYTLYIGPKKLSLLQRLGTKTSEIMQFGFFWWMCVLLVPTLNYFHDLIPDYGVAIILLTLVVRVIFWPLTHKSTESMKRMQALQPMLKEINEKFKDDPQKKSQETWRIYREHKVNPMSSCLPMMIQIPVFIALFTVLRSAVELRYAPFLWIKDLSEPENLLLGQLPFVPALNILPFLMAATMVLQTKLTPAMGDPAQQKMMMWVMPIMMLVMFYGMPSALVLYWTVSQVLAIVQLAWQRRRQAAPDGGTPTSGAPTAMEAMTRQMRRRLAR
ncbi:MAG: YidC/Oxa1 family insertase periplasmic-domain containing protein [Kiritimatiellae bacterium]|nr:YidC/Oxa1 family insertase periplasmic-domain containing protein [Kiritimatiellia bacterium]